MPCAVALRVVSLPATASSSMNMSNSSSLSWSPSISALMSLVTMSSRGSVAPLARQLVDVDEELDERVPAGRRPMYSGSSAPTMRLVQSNSLRRSSCGTPMISAIAWSGSSAAMSSTKSHSTPLDHVVDDRVAR